MVLVHAHLPSGPKTIIWRKCQARFLYIKSTIRKAHSRCVVFSGIQPTGIPHLGNYLGALRPWVNLQNEGNGSCFFSIVDLHALTIPRDGRQLLKLRRESYATLLAIGLHPEKSTIFFQSDVREHSQLMWILSTVASTGHLSRMTQWKSKLGLQEHASIEEGEARANLRLGLFSYPVLQAADVLLYRATHVPVGEDQVQHIEFARSLAKSFNHLYGDKLFTMPEVMISPAKRIMSLKQPHLKMSKSHSDPRSRILITDTEPDIRLKINGALTDSDPSISYDVRARPGVSNLLEILKHTKYPSTSCEDLARDASMVSMRALKGFVGDAVIECLEGIRERHIDLMKPGNEAINLASTDGQKKARRRAGTVMRYVEVALGLRSSKLDSADWAREIGVSSVTGEKPEEEQQEEKKPGEEKTL